VQSLLGLEVYRREVVAGRGLSDAQFLNLTADCPVLYNEATQITS